MDSIDLDALFISLFFFGWLLCAGLAWLVLAAGRRGRAALVTLPAALIGGCLAALLLPLLGFRDGRALILSFPMAALGGLLGTFAVLGAGAMMERRVPAGSAAAPPAGQPGKSHSQPEPDGPEETDE